MPRATKRATQPAPSQHNPNPQLDDVTTLAAAHDALSEPQIRAWIMRADAGDPQFALLKPAIVRIGRSVFIDRPLFAAFIDSRRSAPPSPARSNGRPTNASKRAAA
jgi:hypothetical protein